MKRFKRRAFERKGSSKELQKEESFLLKNLCELKDISLRKSSFDFKEFAKQILP